MTISDRSSNTAFFMLPLRFWEFMLGFLAATFLTNNGNTQHNKPVVGLMALIVITAIALLDANFDLRHPGPAALAICLATTTILITGLPAKLVGSTAGKSFVVLGRYSYSAYLCHFPIILFAAYQPFEGAVYTDQNLLRIAFIVVLTSISSVLMYHFIELPLRRSDNRFTKLPALAITMIAIICTAFYLNQFQQSRYTEQQINIVDAAHDRDTFRCGTSYGLFKPFAKSCDLTTDITNSSRGYLLVGNSHADAIKVALSESATARGYSIRLWKDNFPLGWAKTTADNVISEARKFKINNILLHNSKDTLRVASLRELLQKTQHQGINVTYIDPVPTWSESVPHLIWKETIEGQPRPLKGLGQHHLENVVELRQLNAVVNENYKNFTRIHTAEWLCNPFCKLTDENGVPLYYDSHHLNLRGAYSLKPMFEKILNNPG